MPEQEALFETVVSYYATAEEASALTEAIDVHAKELAKRFDVREIETTWIERYDPLLERD